MAERKFKDYPEAVRMETRFGFVAMKAVSEDAVFIQAESGEYVCVRGVMHSACGHVYADGKGGWTTQPEDRRSPTLSVRRADLKDATPSAKRAVHEEMERVAAEYAAHHREAFHEAALANASNDIMRVEKEIAEGEQALRTLYDRRQALLDRERHCEEALGASLPFRPRR